MRVWLDFNKAQEISAPTIDGRIRVKALKLPKGLKTKT